jgi:hypothetical protein
LDTDAANIAAQVEDDPFDKQRKKMMRVKLTAEIKRSEFPNLQLEELRWFIADSLRYEQANSVEDTDKEIKFSVGLFRPFWNWKLLSSIYGGEVNLQSDTNRIFIVSRLNFIDTVVIASVFVGGLTLANLIFAGKGHILNYLIMWIWIVGGNILISSYRWRRFIRQCVSEAADRVIIPKEHFVANQRSDRERA